MQNPATGICVLKFSHQDGVRILERSFSGWIRGEFDAVISYKKSELAVANSLVSKVIAHNRAD
jgi:hypothetical protein